MSSSTLDKYTRVNVPMPKSSDPNECRVTNKGMMKSYLSFIVNRLSGPLKPGEEEVRDESGTICRQMTLQGMGRTISKVVSLAEIVKRRIPSLHQLTSIKSVELEDVYMPLEEGLEKVTVKRQVASISILLSTVAPSQDLILAAGYQPPATDAEPLHEPIAREEKKKQFRRQRRDNRSSTTNNTAANNAEGDAESRPEDTKPEESSLIAENPGSSTTQEKTAARANRGRRGAGRFRGGRRPHPKSQDQPAAVEANTSTSS